ncbi:Wzz/FepE/Etk N-terminal domain-containing protein [Paracoccus sp. YLB-12]|uniref:Wzz/FepE/Etk N-terminal domain-containing protein n=1 Tax=Paracoccus maritimus TaxID=2933292 RepID=A0ABT2KD14_9RHOB|nr:GNVR domain-containing protein [Paracoccus sp. YLB-12]MCT4334440.1 Wzz/FepE/Etk N-terminal domain-containing protein [Paracoccus sp. YLB-12]
MPTQKTDLQDDVFYATNITTAIWRRRWPIALVAALSMAMGIAVAFSLSDRYRSYAQIRVEKVSPVSSGVSGLAILGGGESEIETEIFALKSRKILGQLIDDLNLRIYAQPDAPPFYQRLPVFGKYFHDDTAPSAVIKVDLLDVPENWQGKEFFLTYEGEDSFNFRLPDETALEGRVGEPLTHPKSGLTLTVASLSGPVGQDFTLRKDRFFSTLAWLQKNLEVFQVRRTDLVTLSMTDFDAERSQKILAAALDVYSAFNNDYVVEKAQKRLDHVEGELPVAMKAIDEAEEALKEFQEESRMIDVQIQTEYLLKLLAENEALLRQDQRPAEQERLEEIRDEIMKSLGEIPNTQQQMLNLQRDIEIAQEIYIGLMKVVQEQRVQRASAYGTVRILDEPLADDRPVGRGRSIIILAVTFLGTILAMVVAIAKAHRRREDSSIA